MMKTIAGAGIQRSGLIPKLKMPFKNIPNLVDKVRHILTMKLKQDASKKLKTGGALRRLRSSKTQGWGLFLERSGNLWGLSMLLLMINLNFAITFSAACGSTATLTML